jgi:hypothetical protein
MRLLGVICVLAGAAATVWAVAGAFEKRRPLDVLCALVAPLCLAVALLGAVLLFVPGFLG